MKIIGTQHIIFVSMPSWVVNRYNFTTSVNEISTKTFLEIINLDVNLLSIHNQNADSSTGESNKFSIYFCVRYCRIRQNKQ